MNNSIFSTIKNSKNKYIFGEICALENKLKAKRSQKQTIDFFASEMESAIENLLKFLIKVEIVTVDVSISNHDKAESQKKPTQPNKMAEGRNLSAKH